MLSRFARMFLAVGLLVALWGLSLARRPVGSVWVRPLDARPGPVRILRFYASVGVAHARTDGATLLLAWKTPSRCASRPCNAVYPRAGPLPRHRCPSTPRTTPCWPKATMARSRRAPSPCPCRRQRPARCSTPTSRVLQYAVAPQHHHAAPTAAPIRKNVVARTAQPEELRFSVQPRIVAHPGLHHPAARSSPVCAPVPRRWCRWWTSVGC